jgi:hypothetical protein
MSSQLHGRQRHVNKEETKNVIFPTVCPMPLLVRGLIYDDLQIPNSVLLCYRPYYTTTEIEYYFRSGDDFVFFSSCPLGIYSLD